MVGVPGVEQATAKKEIRERRERERKVNMGLLQ